ncbi:MAG: septum formation inhibitor Maf [Oscillospiraceae bacterium]|nr:septum formation inhibitor Maf [Oscillospiraceae bacterium]
MAIILASKSPRRKELLSQMGLTFSISVADIDEYMESSIPVCDAVGDLSCRKAMAVPCGKEDVVIAADTVVVIDGEVLGKPHTEEEAKKMLRRLSSRTHEVMTGVTVRDESHAETFTEITKVTFRDLSENEISAYVKTGDPMDKAGSYGVQGKAGMFVSALEGDYFNVMGLPICRLSRVLRHFHVEVLGEKG